MGELAQDQNWLVQSFLACRLEQTGAKLLSPRNTMHRNLSSLVFSIRSVFEKVTFAKTLPNSGHLHINYNCPVLQMQVYMLAQERFGAIQAETLH